VQYLELKAYQYMLDFTTFTLDFVEIPNAFVSCVDASYEIHKGLNHSDIEFL
jgi:hypothetical protein